jgi:FixJ family two-component response regulator
MEQIRSLVELVPLSSVWTFERQADPLKLHRAHGTDRAYRLKADRIFVPVIYISGNRDPAVRKAALDSGCIAFLTKPFSAQELIEPLKRAGRHPQQRRHALTRR